MPENQNPDQKSHSHEAIPFQLTGRAMSIWRSLGSDILAQDWKSMWKPYIVSILYLIVKKVLLVIFLDFVYWKLSIFRHFWPKLDFHQIMKKHLQKLVKIQSKIDLKTTFAKTFQWFDKKQALVKIVWKWTIFSKQSLRND